MGTFLFLTNTGIWLYVAWRFVARLPARRGFRIGLALLLLPLAEYYLLASAAFGSMASIGLPHWAMIALGWAFGAFLLVAVLVLLRDLLGLLALPVARATGRFILGSRGLTLGIGAAAMLLAAWGTWQAVRVPAVKTVNITIPGLPEAFDGYRIVQLTDLHASRLLPGSWIAAVVARSNRLHPDLIVLTGDLQDGSPAERAADVRPMRGFRAPDGVLAVPGNHEYYTDYPGWMSAFRGLGLHMLENAHVLIHRHGEGLAVAGITDRQAKRFGQAPPDLDAALAGIPPGTPVILLSHRPDNARASARAGVALQLSGHTHGGQILGLDRLTKWANAGHVSGLYRVGPLQLHVSNGTGLWNGLAIRLGRPSEITLLVLHPA